MNDREVFTQEILLGKISILLHTRSFVRIFVFVYSLQPSMREGKNKRNCMHIIRGVWKFVLLFPIQPKSVCCNYYYCMLCLLTLR